MNTLTKSLAFAALLAAPFVMPTRAQEVVLPRVAPVGGAAAPAKAAAKDARDTVVVEAETEKVIKAALKYLAAKQTSTGAWTSPNGEHPVAVTGYTLMAMLAAGQLPGEGEYGKQVSLGVSFLMSCVRADGYITSEALGAGRRSSNMYDHGIAMIALAEVYGQTQEPKLKEKLTDCIKLVVSAQNNEGGWRYSPRPESADISVTVLQVVALRACKNAGLDVPGKTLDDAIKFVKMCSDRSGGFTYQPKNAAPGFARTAAAIYSLQVCGYYTEELTTIDAQIRGAVKPEERERLEDRKRTLQLVQGGSAYLIEKKSDMEYYSYGHFYAAPAQYMIGGDTWVQWYKKITAELLPLVKREGDIAYWNEKDPKGIGPVYATAVYTMMLAMPYHYVPLYQR